MANRKTVIATGEIYHIYNRGVEKRDIFLDDLDYQRFIHDLYEFNDENSVGDYKFISKGTKTGKKRITTTSSTDTKPALGEVEPPQVEHFTASTATSSEIGGERYRKHERKPLVDILAFCLMKNHFHLMLRQRVDGGISEFMHKIGTGYTMYFNKKNNRSGTLFQGKYKSVHTAKENQFRYLPIYIHLNPLDYIYPEWREKEVNETDKAIEYLKNYRWSSLPDYMGIHNYPSVINKEIFEEKAGKSLNHAGDVIDWLRNMNKLAFADTKEEGKIVKDE